MSEKMFARVGHKNGLKSTTYTLQGADGKALNVLGTTAFSFKLGSTQYRHKFHVIQHVSRNLILDTDSLLAHKVRIYFDLEKLD